MCWHKLLAIFSQTQMITPYGVNVMIEELFLPNKLAIIGVFDSVQLFVH
jgi:hypothetical protein